ncbi:hypothetical protein B0T18DRAFT_436483 [Schizothecium vesticola]|uniref:Chitin-binding type-4 domain-containing protein n=1 Tax=Schizothecium vesticola TaxID=314040 RepID=A0AA40F785_9PEZI|nr:hypothetical protein B0T18DRAFT_436483 [Schizothecium vesticola]
MLSPLLLLTLPTLALSHGLISSPLFTRAPGPLTAAACGATMQKFYIADPTSYPEALLRANPSGLRDGYDATRCNLWLCKGYQFGDQPASAVQTWAAGTEVPIEVKVRIPHTGYANVSVVDTGKNEVVGGVLKAWASGYAASTTLPGDQGKFVIKVPELGGRCVTAGVCVLQWHWYGQGQTYQSCIDFVQPAAAVARGLGWRF